MASPSGPDYYEVSTQSVLTREELLAEIKAHENQQIARLIKWIAGMIAGGVVSILVGGIAWGILTNTVNLHQADLADLKPQVAGVVVRMERFEATRATSAEAADLDKRLQRVEDQNAMIMEQLKKIDAKL